MKIGEMTRYQFEVSIGGKYEDVVKENAAITVLRKVELFRPLELPEMKKLFGVINISKYEDGNYIFEENEPGDCIYIIKKGKVDIFIKD
jgi:signal-transduction protein with cAMP-binding, CBS, and nucleotidyltransferase domain